MRNHIFSIKPDFFFHIFYVQILYFTPEEFIDTVTPGKTFNQPFLIFPTAPKMHGRQALTV